LIVGLLLIGFGIKVGIVPLHVWLPLAHPAAPTPASAVLSGAIIKAGLLGWLRFLPLGEVSQIGWGNLWLSVGLLTIFYGVIVGVMQREAKTVLAYSSISQMGLLTVGIGGGLLMHTAWPMILSAVLVFALHHGFSKGCLFLSVGVAPSAQGTTIAKRFFQAGLVIPALVLAGAPLTMGAISKSVLKDSLAVLSDQWPMVLDVLLPLTSAGTTLLMARFLYLIWPNAAEMPTFSTLAKELPSPIAEKTMPTMTMLPTTTMRWAWAASLVLVMAAPWLIPAGILTRPSLSLILEYGKISGRSVSAV
jgi:formate hydrogenlyase subunit 3/multisubunit Na+/H+ antiporter MnhD subunit